MVREFGEDGEVLPAPRPREARAFDSSESVDGRKEPVEDRVECRAAEDRHGVRDFDEKERQTTCLGAIAASEVASLDHAVSETSRPETGRPHDASEVNLLLERHPNLDEFNVADVNYEDNPILDGFHHKGAEPEDYEWAVRSFDEVVRPEVDGGATREDLEAIDSMNGNQPMRELANVHDMFLGSNPIRLEVREDGSLNPIDGRHRIEMARRLGINTLVGEVRRGR